MKIQIKSAIHITLLTLAVEAIIVGTQYKAIMSQVSSTGAFIGLVVGLAIMAVGIGGVIGYFHQKNVESLNQLDNLPQIKGRPTYNQLDNSSQVRKRLNSPSTHWLAVATTTSTYDLALQDRLNNQKAQGQALEESIGNQDNRVSTAMPS